MQNLYLIAHMAAGQPTLGVAEKVTCSQCDGEGCEPTGMCNGHGYWWLLDTGWRAYPYWVTPLAPIMDQFTLPPPPEDAIDTWWADGKDGPEAQEDSKIDLVAQLGLAQPSLPFNRRV